MKFPYNDIISLLDERLEFNLAESTNKDLILEEIWDEDFCEGLKRLKLEYGTSQGNSGLRRKIAEKLDVPKNQIVITNGASYGIFLSMLCFCEPGDEIITVQPNFPPTMDLIEGLGFKRVLLKLSFEKGYQIDIDELFNKVTTKTKLIILVSPLNPTGTTHTKDEIKEISEKLNKKYPTCRLLIDETYREATYGKNKVIPTYAGMNDKILTVSSFSKCHGTPGLRVGWLQSSDIKFIEQVQLAKMNTVISNSVLDEYVALRVLEKEPEIFESRRIHSSKGLDLTKKWIDRNSSFVSWNEPKSGALCCIKLKEEKYNKQQVEKFYLLSKESGIQIANGNWFGESNRYFRLGFGYMDIENLSTTLYRLTEILNSI